MKLAVTGATGFLGREVVDRALLARQSVRGLVAAGRRYPDPRPGLDVAEVPDFEHEAPLAACLEGADAVLHLAGHAHKSSKDLETDRAVHDLVNHRHAVVLARAAAQAGVPRLVFASSIAVFGLRTSDAPLTDESPSKPSTPYGEAKLDAETGLKLIAAQTGLAVTALRLPLLAGANAPGNLERLARLVLKGLPLGFTGSNSRSLLSVRDGADAVLAAAHLSAPDFAAYCVADDQTLSTAQIVAAIAEGAGRSRWSLPLPSSPQRAVLHLLGKGQLADQLFGSLVVDGSRFAEQAGWSARHGATAALWELGQSHVSLAQAGRVQRAS